MIKKTAKRLVKLMLYLVIPVYMGYHFVQEQIYRANMPMGEVIGPDENAVMADGIAMGLNMINRTRDGLTEDGLSGDETQAGNQPNMLVGLFRKLTGNDDLGETTKGHDGPVVYRRDVHIKSHGCVAATLSVPELENKYRWGVFREPNKEYKAWIRYSNGDPTLKPDKARDARGMAIKLMGVEGEKLLPGQRQAGTQDFVMMNATNYFIRHLADYVELTKYLAVGDNLGYFLNGWSMNPFSWRFRELKLVAGTKKKPPETPLLTQYFSASSYKLGPDNNIKFSVKPKQCTDKNGEPVEGKSDGWETPKKDYNFLRLRMAEQLAAGPACFDFMVQLQVPGKIMPVEDSTIVWSEKDSPFVTVASLEIPQQEFNTEPQNTFCENLSYNPWHSLPEHRPTGVFNRVRKALYEEIAKYRYDANQQQYDDPSGPALDNSVPIPPEPTSWDISKK
jgi:catalase